MRRVVLLEQPLAEVVSATLYWSALGIAEMWVNGQPASESLLVPGWTTYERRLRYAEADVTDLIGQEFVLAAQLSAGWYAGRLGWRNQASIYGDQLALIASLHIQFRDGRCQTVRTDSEWSSSPGALCSADLYDGVTVDMRLEDEWRSAAYDDDGWAGTHAVLSPQAELVPFVSPPIERVAVVKPRAAWRAATGEMIIDFGQNLVGWLRIRVRGSRGHRLIVRHAEVLDDGALARRTLRSAEATDTYFLSGGQDDLEPTHTFHGFRYASIDGWPGGDPAEILSAVDAVVISSALRRTGRFRCSDININQLHDNVVWSTRGNFVGLPTDCPQRDERLGWTGDIAVFAPTAAFLFDTRRFLADWLQDVDAEQRLSGGRVPHVVPDIMKYDSEYAGLPATPTAIWGDAAVWVPWAMWVAYGDRVQLRSHFDSMLMHARSIQRLLSPTGLWDRGFQFGDWLDPDAPPDNPVASKADPGVVATACAYRTFAIVSAVAELIGEAGDRGHFAELAAETRRAFQAAYVDKGVIVSDCTTVYALALAFGLLDPPEQQLAAERLRGLIVEDDFHISSGFAGTPFVLDALSQHGYTDVAIAMLRQTDGPGWMLPVTLGATTVWERWDSMSADGKINPGEMTSFNHYALGAVADWLHRVIGGIAWLDPGQRHLWISPEMAETVEWAETTLDVASGTVQVSWHVREHAYRLEVAVPPGHRASVVLPDRPVPCEVGPGTYVFTGLVRFSVSAPRRDRHHAHAVHPRSFQGGSNTDRLKMEAAAW